MGKGYGPIKIATKGTKGIEVEKERKSGVRWCARCRLLSRLVSLTVAWSVAWLTMSSQESETSKSELEMAIEYSEYLAESGDEDDHVLQRSSYSRIYYLCITRIR